MYRSLYHVSRFKRFRSNSSIPTPQPRRTKMEWAQWLALRYVGGMFGTIVGCVMLIDTYRDFYNQRVHGYEGLLDPFIVLSLAVFWPICIPFITVTWAGDIVIRYIKPKRN